MNIFDHPYQIEHLMVVGLGGSGSQISRTVARILYDMQQRNLQTPQQVTFVDPDIVEAHNIGRQMFTAQHIGYHKAEILARTFNAALGLSIAWHNTLFDASMADPYPSKTVILGCVDNFQARRSMAETERALWIDCGNDYDHGQVVIGNSNQYETASTWHLRDKSIAESDTCYTQIPNVATLMPEILMPPPEEETAIQVVDDLSCAELVQKGDQHVLINEYVALAAGQMLYKVLHRQPIDTHIVYVDSDMMMMSPRQIEPPAKEAEAGVA